MTKKKAPEERTGEFGVIGTNTRKKFTDIPPDFPFHLGHGIRSTRRNLGISVEEAARKLGVHVTVFYRAERRPWLEAGALAAYANALGVTPADIVKAGTIR